jgi:hypothetical protein
MVGDVVFTPERFDCRSPDMSSREAWGGVPAWRIKNLRIALIDAEQRGADPGDSGADFSHRALRRRFDRGRQALEVIACNFGLFRSLARRSAYGSSNDRAWVSTFLLHYVAYGRLSDRQADVLRHIARRWGVEPPMRDAFVDWAPRIIRTPAPPPRVRSPRPDELTRRLGRHEVVLRTGEVVTLLELLEIGLRARGAGRRSPVRVLRDAAASALAEREDGIDDESDGDDDTPQR